MQLGLQIALVGTDGLDAERQLIGDFGHGGTGHQQPQNFQLTVGQRRMPARRIGKGQSFVQRGSLFQANSKGPQPRHLLTENNQA
jgi:hypothetical protein